MPWEAPVVSGPIRATVRVPGSKSESARALILAAIAMGPGEIDGLLDSRDTSLMRAALTALGASIDDLGPGRVRVTPPAQMAPEGTIDCGLSGTVMRFVPPLAALAAGRTDFVGDPEASARPISPVLEALASLGATISGAALPFAITGPVSRGGAVSVDGSGSSQFISALLLAAPRYPGGLTVRHTGATLPSRPHIDMTVRLLADRGVAISEPSPGVWVVPQTDISGRNDRVQPDLTNAATLAAAALVTGGEVRTAWPTDTVQGGEALASVLEQQGASITRDGSDIVVNGERGIRGADLDLHAVSELTCVAAALAALADGPTRLRGVAHIRGHETDRLAALAQNLNGLGGRVSETDDGLLIDPVPLRGGLFPTYADHRMAHAGALLGLAVPGVVLDDVACTTKTLPDFPGQWAELVAGAR